MGSTVLAISSRLRAAFSELANGLSVAYFISDGLVGRRDSKARYFCRGDIRTPGLEFRTWYSMGCDDASGAARGEGMTPEEALRHILKLVDGAEEIEDVRALQILLQSIRTLAEKGLGESK
jgi:hypothetical protein